MSRRNVGLVGLSLLGLVLGLAVGVQASPDESRELGGTWKLEGWNMGSDPEADADYTGEVVLDHKGKQTYTVEWKIGGKVVNSGVGLYDERTDTFAAGYAIRNKPGVAIWQFSEDGQVMSCVGTFQGKIGDVAWERWSRE